MGHWEVEYTDEFGDWWDTLSPKARIDVEVVVELLEERGPTLDYPFSSNVNASRHGHMRELRVQHKGKPHRVLYAFDPRRSVILLIGGDKTGNKRWYEEFVPKADRLYDEHIRELKKEGAING